MSTPGAVPQGVPPQGFQQPYGPPRRRWGMLVAGLVIGLVVGGGGLGLAWMLSSGSSGTDIDAVCDLVARTEPLTKDFELGDMRRLAGVGELAAALAEDDPTHKPLATALEEGVRAAQNFDLEQSGTSLRRAQDICQA